MADPIADMLTRIRNAKQRRHAQVSIPFSNLKLAMIQILRDEGLIRSYKVTGESYKRALDVSLKYTDREESVIEGLKRVSKQGRRVYVGAEELPRVKGGMGIAILSTSKGLMTQRACRTAKIGGEVLCYVW
jgi:small subunit ribosomal protein S8